MTRKKRTRWSYSKGDYGETVSVYQAPNGRMYGRRPHEREKALKHNSRERAKAWVKEEHRKFAAGLKAAASHTPTLEAVIELYMQNQSPRRCKTTQKADERCEEMFKEYFGAKKNMRNLTRGDVERFETDRRSGLVDARGKRVKKKQDRRRVRQRSVANDLEWLRGVILWANSWELPNGRLVMDENPMRSIKIAKEKNPRRPVATHDRFQATRAVSDQVKMDVRRQGKRIKIRSYLSEILDVANGTGRRISAILQLKYEDLRLEDGQHGAIHWPADTDKMGKESVVPINQSVRRAIDRQSARREAMGSSQYLFPSPRNTRRAISKDLASDWLERAEKIAELPRLQGSLWHAYRRKFACERKDMSDVDVAAAGGWSDLTCLKTAYQQPDDAMLYRVVSQPAELRDAK